MSGSGGPRSTPLQPLMIGKNWKASPKVESHPLATRFARLSLSLSCSFFVYWFWCRIQIPFQWPLDHGSIMGVLDIFFFYCKYTATNWQKQSFVFNFDFISYYQPFVEACHKFGNNKEQAEKYIGKVPLDRRVRLYVKIG